MTMPDAAASRDAIETGSATVVATAPADAPASDCARTQGQSAVYEGLVRHRRHFPHAHVFQYRICMLYLDLDEVDTLFDGRWLWSAGSRNLAEYRRSDYLGDPRVPLAESVRERVRAETGKAPRGPIRLLTHLRYFGHCFNPVSFYYCFAEDGRTLEAVVAEITNTPWKERHSYVLPVTSAQKNGRALGWSFAKAFHVSPFLSMQRRYAWRLTAPADSLRVHMDVCDGDVREVDATLVLERREVNAANLARVLLRFPAMTLRVVGAIHWQALRLWMRGNPVYDHPSLSSGKHGT